MWAFICAAVLLQGPVDDSMAAALAREQAGDDVGAVTALNAWVRKNPQSELGHLELARLGLKQGSAAGLDLAELHVEIAASVAPESPRAQFLWGQVLEERGRFQKAQAAYERAVFLRPVFVEARFRLGGLLLAAQQPDAAALQFDAIKSQDRTAVPARLQLAEAEEKAGRVAAAEAELKALHRELPGSSVAVRRLAELYERTGRSAQAKKLRTEPSRNLRPLLKSKR